MSVYHKNHINKTHCKKINNRMMENLSDTMARCFETVQDEEDQETIPADHKCWNCEWRTFVGNGFFCPLVGCVKPENHSNFV